MELLVLEISTKIVQNFRKVMEKRGLKSLDPPKTLFLTDLALSAPKSTLLLGPSYVFFSVAFLVWKWSQNEHFFASKTLQKQPSIS